jgi:hypothetical protein
LANGTPATTTALATLEAQKEPWRDAEWQNLWLALKARSRTSLALVPASVGGPPDLALTIAVTLARIGMLHIGTQIHVADATRISLAHLEQFNDEVRRLNADGELVIMALPTIMENPLSASLARSAGGSVLCILLGHMSMSETKRTIAKIGQSNILGTIVLHADEVAEAAKAAKR